MLHAGGHCRSVSMLVPYRSAGIKSEKMGLRIIWLLAALTHFSTGCIAPTTAASEMSRRWCAKNDLVAPRPKP